MTLADLIDLEAQLARDRDADPATLAARDRAWLAGSGTDDVERRAARDGASRAAPTDRILRRWLDGARDAEPGKLHPGAAIERGLGTTRALLAVLGLVLGWGSATGLLAFAGEHPVNVWDFLLAFVATQVVLLLLLVASFFVPLGAFGRPAAGMARGAVAWLYARFASRSARGRERGAEWRTLWHRLRSRRSLYQHVEPWLLLGVTQGFGVAFNVGALLGLLRLVVFSDLAFAWSTTLVDLDASRFHALASGVAAPWSAILPDAVPSLDLVAATRYSRLEGAYLTPGDGRAASPEAVGGWWPFLAAALVFYGLLPRLLLLGLARLRTATLLRRLPLDDAEVTRVARRLSEPHVETRGASAEVALARAGGALAEPAGPAAAGRCALVLWRDVPASEALAAAVSAQAGCSVAVQQAAGGRDFDEADVDWGAFAAGADPVVVVAESFEAPDRAALRFLRGLRSALGPRRHVLVLLSGGSAGVSATTASAQSVRVWREGLATLEDPWLAVEPLRALPLDSAGGDRVR